MTANLQKKLGQALGISYKIVKPLEKAMSWDDYAAIMDSEWSALLTARTTGEQKFQKFSGAILRSCPKWTITSVAVVGMAHSPAL